MVKKVTREEHDATSLQEIALTDRRGNDRRRRNERRMRAVPVAVDRRKGDRRTGERRRQIDPTTCERDYDTEELEFMKAIEDYKRNFARPFPTWSEVLEVARAMGYRKVAEPTTIPQNRAKLVSSDEF
jgi:hypothetical protein